MVIIIFHKRVVSKEIVVLCRWGVETNVWFISRVQPRSQSFSFLVGGGRESAGHVFI